MREGVRVLGRAYARACVREACAETGGVRGGPGGPRSARPLALRVRPLFNLELRQPGRRPALGVADLHHFPRPRVRGHWARSEHVTACVAAMHSTLPTVVPRLSFVS